MNFMMCSVWDNFSRWVSLEWTQTTYAIVLTVFAVAGILGFLSFFKANKKDQEKIAKWGMLLVPIVCFVIVAVLVAAKF